MVTVAVHVVRPNVPTDRALSGCRGVDHFALDQEGLWTVEAGARSLDSVPQAPHQIKILTLPEGESGLLWRAVRENRRMLIEDCERDPASDSHRDLVGVGPPRQPATPSAHEWSPVASSSSGLLR